MTSLLVVQAVLRTKDVEIGLMFLLDMSTMSFRIVASRAKAAILALGENRRTLEQCRALIRQRSRT